MMHEEGPRFDREKVMTHQNMIRGEVTFKDFVTMAKRRGLTEESLVELFRDKFGDSNNDVKDFFKRMFQPRYEENFIPYRRVLAFYRRQITEEADSLRDIKSQRRCACGCGRPVWGHKKYASDSCKNRVYLQNRSRTSIFSQKKSSKTEKLGVIKSVDRGVCSRLAE